jgi:S1-C subfamily serine protease
MEMIDEVRRVTKQVREQVGPAVVAIGRNGRGTGIVVAPGQVLTNAHNLRDTTTSVTFADGRVDQATAAGVDEEGDLAVLTVDTGAITPLEWATEPVEAGDVVFTSAAGGRVTMGLVSATGRSFRGPRGRRIHGSVEHTAPLGPGSSGGPVVDPNAKLVALNTHRIGFGFYLAVPADADLRARVDALAAGRSPEHRRIGVAIVPSRVAARLRRAVGLPEREGLLVRAVEDGSPAANAGIVAGDLLVKAGGVELRTADDLFSALDAAGENLEVDFVRGVDEHSVTVVFTPAS